MSNNRSSNRRRGRGGNRPQGGGNQLNRIDSRARGNAPQLLEKYKKLAHDASMNGDRVQAEYYLQFADHYFRVMADSRPQRDEQRPRREFDREGASDDEEFYGEDDRQERQDRPQQQEQPDRAPRAENDEGDRGQEGAATAGDDENPFVRREPREPRRESRNESRGEGRGERQPRGNGRDGGRGNGRDGGREDRREQESAGLDPSILPPAIGIDAAPSDSENGGEKPKRTRRPRVRAPDGDGDETLEAVG